jgi:hypothetical protein
MPDTNAADAPDEWWVNTSPDEFLRAVANETTEGLTTIEAMVQLLLLAPTLTRIMDTVVVDQITLRQLLTTISEHRHRSYKELVTAITYAEAYAQGEIGRKTSNLADMKAIVRREVDRYAVDVPGCKLYAVLDDLNQTYGVICVPDNSADRPAWIVMLTHIVDDYVVIDEDTTDKPLVDALMINGGIPREKIILAYAGETLPEHTASG